MVGRRRRGRYEPPRGGFARPLAILGRFYSVVQRMALVAVDRVGTPKRWLRLHNLPELSLPTIQDGAHHISSKYNRSLFDLTQKPSFSA